jgi:hypothetical protein
METLWSMSTTVREAERIIGFLKTEIEMDGKEWNDSTQIEFQIRLIKNREYLNNPDNTQSFHNLNEEQIKLLKDKSIEMTYEQAEEIFKAKNYESPSMRGRQSMAPLVKLGLVYTSINGEKKISVSSVGKMLANGEISFPEFMLDTLLKYQYPNPYDSGFQKWNTKPFINTLRLIKKVNDLCRENNLKEKGISKLEFGIFVLSLKSYQKIDDTAVRILKFREQYEALDEDERNEFVKNYIEDYLSDFNNPVKNVNEYTDNMIRYIRLTKYIYIRGKYAHTYIDLEPRRMTEINSILENDDGSAENFTQEQWRNYMGVYGTYKLPFETFTKLTEILKSVNDEINILETKLSFHHTVVSMPATKDELKKNIEERREYRTKLQNLEIKEDYHTNAGKIDEAIEALENIKNHRKASLAKKYSIELEKWTNIALNIINDSELIKPNAPVGDDNEPIYTAPSGVADIECFYKSFNAICEVTMLTNRDQWHNEGQPVMRHLREFEEANNDKVSYCLFIAPKLHVDTVNTFYMSVKYEYQGKKQKIVPITIEQLESILKTIKKLVIKGKALKHDDMMDLYERCINLSSIPDSTVWLNHISNSLEEWEKELVS